MTALRLALPAALAAALAIPSSVVAAGTSIRSVQAQGKSRASANLSGQKNPMLNTFHLKFTNGDHKVRKIAIEPGNDRIDATLADRNSDDPIKLEARLIDSTNSYALRKVTRKCTGACTVPIVKNKSKGAQLFLAGFSFRRVKGGDSNIKTLQLMPNSDSTAYQVDFSDDGTFEYEVTIHYGFYGASRTRKRDETLTGYRLPGKRNSVIKMTKSRSASASTLRGFSFKFLNGDHHLKDIAVQQDSKRQYSVRFNDNNYDDPVMAQLDIVYLG